MIQEITDYWIANGVHMKYKSLFMRNSFWQEIKLGDLNIYLLFVKPWGIVIFLLAVECQF